MSSDDAFPFEGYTVGQQPGGGNKPPPAPPERPATRSSARSTSPGAPSGEGTGKTHMLLVNRLMCRGPMKGSGGAKLCVARRCETKFHVSDKTGVPEEGAIFLRVPGKEQVFAEPRLSILQLPAGFDIDDLEAQQQPPDALRALMLTQLEAEREAERQRETGYKKK